MSMKIRSKRLKYDRLQNTKWLHYAYFFEKNTIWTNMAILLALNENKIKKEHYLIL